MPELEFRVEGELSKRPAQGRKENRSRAPSNGGTKLSGKVLGLSLKSTLLIVAVVVTLSTISQRRSAVSLNSFGPSSTRQPAPTGAEAFGTPIWFPHSLKGDIYLIPTDTSSLPDFETLHPVGTVYTKDLNVTRRSVSEGFPGMIGTTQPYAIDFSGAFDIDRDGPYRFALTSDDGSKLFVDGELIVNNDGCHPPALKDGVATLSR